MQNRAQEKADNVWSNFENNYDNKCQKLQERIKKVNERAEKASAKINSLKGSKQAITIKTPGELNKSEKYEGFVYKLNYIEIEEMLDDVKEIHKEVSDKWLNPDISNYEDLRGKEPKFGTKEHRESLELLFKRNKVPSFDYIHRPTQGYYIDEQKKPRTVKNQKRISYLDNMMLFDQGKNVFSEGRNERELFQTRKKKNFQRKRVEVKNKFDYEVPDTMKSEYQLPNIDTAHLQFVPKQHTDFKELNMTSDGLDLDGIVDIDQQNTPDNLINNMSLNQSAFNNVSNYSALDKTHMSMAGCEIGNSNYGIRNQQQQQFFEQQGLEPQQQQIDNRGNKGSSIQSERPQNLTQQNIQSYNNLPQQQQQQYQGQAQGQQAPGIPPPPPISQLLVGNTANIPPPPPLDLLTANPGGIPPPPPLHLLPTLAGGMQMAPNADGQNLNEINGEPGKPDLQKIQQVNDLPNDLVTPSRDCLMAEIRGGNFKLKKPKRKASFLMTDEEKAKIKKDTEIKGEDAFKAQIERRFRQLNKKNIDTMAAAKKRRLRGESSDEEDESVIM